MQEAGFTIRAWGTGTPISIAATVATSAAAALGIVGQRGERTRAGRCVSMPEHDDPAEAQPAQLDRHLLLRQRDAFARQLLDGALLNLCLVPRRLRCHHQQHREHHDSCASLSPEGWCTDPPEFVKSATSSARACRQRLAAVLAKVPSA